MDSGTKKRLSVIDFMLSFNDFCSPRTKFTRLAIQSKEDKKIQKILDKKIPYLFTPYSERIKTYGIFLYWSSLNISLISKLIVDFRRVRRGVDSKTLFCLYKDSKFIILNYLSMHKILLQVVRRCFFCDVPGVKYFMKCDQTKCRWSCYRCLHKIRKWLWLKK